MARGLGRGLESLIPAAAKVDKSSAQRTVPVEKIKPNPYQPRTRFDPQALQELADSIRRQGLIQPLIVTPLGENGDYELIAGERRWRASQMAGLSEVPVVVKKVSKQDQFQIALIENI